MNGVLNHCDHEFRRRVSKIPFHGIGLSVDVYDPDLLDLLPSVEQMGQPVDYVEVFKAPGKALRELCSRFPGRQWEYHAEGLWVTQPDWPSSYPMQEELAIAADHLRTLDCYWINQECASKQLAGYAFGTYLPPVFSELSAAVTAHHSKGVQAWLDSRLADARMGSPLFLLETPPLTYFGFGDVAYAKYFQYVAKACACGFVLDIGHLWTVYRYTGEWRVRSLEDFLEEFLETFPLERVVQIHLAGLDWAATVRSPTNGDSEVPPSWIDSHGSPVPQVLWDMLDQVLARERLISLKGIALEVDTKAPEWIRQEFALLRERVGSWRLGGRETSPKAGDHAREPLKKWEGSGIGEEHIQELLFRYRQYVRTATAQIPGYEGLPPLGGRHEEHRRHLATYVQDFLPYEVLIWGGALEDMFPQTVRVLQQAGIDLREFVRFWYSCSRTFSLPYDFFLLKVDRFLEFVLDRHPQALQLAVQEAEANREGYSLANEGLRGK